MTATRRRVDRVPRPSPRRSRARRRVMVTLMSLCPTVSRTVWGGTPSASSSDTAVLRRNRRVATPAASRRGAEAPVGGDEPAGVGVRAGVVADGGRGEPPGGVTGGLGGLGGVLGEVAGDRAGGDLAVVVDIADGQADLPGIELDAQGLLSLWRVQGWRVRVIGPGTSSRIRRRCGRWVRRGTRRRCRRAARSGSGRIRPVRALPASPHGAAHRRFNRSTGRCRAWRRPVPGCR